MRGLIHSPSVIVLIAAMLMVTAPASTANAQDFIGGYGTYFRGYSPYGGYGFGSNYPFLGGGRGYYTPFYSSYYYSPYTTYGYPYYGNTTYNYPYSGTPFNYSPNRSAYSPFYPDAYTPRYNSPFPTANTGNSDNLQYMTGELTPPDNRAYLTVQVSDPDAILVVNGHRTALIGTTRVFRSPPLESGQYNYEMTATWIENGRTFTQTKNIRVSANSRSAVGFTEEQAAE